MSAFTTQIVIWKGTGDFYIHLELAELLEADYKWDVARKKKDVPKFNEWPIQTLYRQKDGRIFTPHIHSVAFRTSSLFVSAVAELLRLRSLSSVEESLWPYLDDIEIRDVSAAVFIARHGDGSERVGIDMVSDRSQL